MRNPIRYIAEQFTDVSRTWWSGGISALRSMFTWQLFGTPGAYKTGVDFDMARRLYRNSEPTTNLGSGFVRPVIDLSVEYMGLPSVTSDDGERDTWLNECIHDHWGPQLIEIFRDSMRDSKSVVRYRQPSLLNPLFSERDRMHGTIEALPPDLVDITFDPADADLIERAIVHHWIDVDERTDEAVQRGDIPKIKEHHILEVVTPEDTRWFDQTDNKELTTWRTVNDWRFVPMWPVWNEYDASLGGGQSDIEPIYPFVQAFHEVLLQALNAHKYHSTPKAKFKLKDIYPFLRNNYPDVLDENGQVKTDAKVNWQGREIFFLSQEEDIDFVEATSVLGDSKTLLDFLIDCIAITSETPRWALLKESKVTDKDASVQPFEKKIERKRLMFQPAVQMICRMAMAATGKTPEALKLTWPPLRLELLAAKAQSIQQIVMALDVASDHEWVADETSIRILSQLFEQINSPEVEQKLAKTNIVPAAAMPAPASPTQGAQGNGKTSRTAAKRAVATTTPSRS